LTIWKKSRSLNVSLTADDLREIENHYSQITVHGERLSPQHIAWIDR
jgi:hypothetical protein